MSVGCVLETERGKPLARVDDPEEALNSLIPAMTEARFQCWRFIDQYGETVFNSLQMDTFLEEAAIIRSRTTEKAAVAVLESIEALARRCQSQMHTYLRFSGD
jgi:hypothetical protein